MVGLGSHLSVTVIVAVICTSLWSGGQSTAGDSWTVRSGGVVSTIFTCCVAWPTFLESSVADQVTVVVPSLKSCGASLLMSGEASHTSVAVALPMSTAVPVGPVHSACALAGAVTLGGVVSTTPTLVVSSSYWPNVSMTLNTYDGVLCTARSCSAVGRVPTSGPTRLPRNQPMDAMLLSGACAVPSSVKMPRPIALHSTVRSGPASALGGWLTSVPLMSTNISMPPSF